MSKNYMSLEIGGQKRGLKFSMGTLRRLNELTGNDPFSFFVGGDIESQIKQVATIIEAALLSNCASKKEEPDFTSDDVQQWAEDLSMDDATAIVNGFREAYKADDASREGSADTRE